MLKIIYYNSKNPTDSRVIELNPETSENFECKVGRENNCSLILPSTAVSRIHGVFSLISEHYHFTDLVSKVGTKLNNELIPKSQAIALKTGDILQIANFVLEIISIDLAQDSTIMIDRDDSELTIPIEKLAASKVCVPSTPATPIDQPDDHHEALPVALPIETSKETSTHRQWTGGKLTVKCVRVTNETSEAKTFTFVTDPAILFTYKPGQFVTLELEINGKKVFRSYSISSTPSRPHTLEITVKRVPAPENHLPPGLVSNWLHENILDGAMGKFTCFGSTNQKLLMISAGSGITPMMSMSRWIYDTCGNSDVMFLHSACNGSDIIFRQELELMATKEHNFHLAITLTKPIPGQVWTGLKGRITPQMLQVITPDFSDRTVYVCGPSPFMKHTKAMLKELGFPMENYHEESFGGTKKFKKSSANTINDSQPISATTTTRFGISAFLDNLQLKETSSMKLDNPSAVKTVNPPKSTQSCIVFAKADKEVLCDGEESILEVAEQAGIKMRSGCRAGSCGACKKLKLEGNVKMENFDPEALNPTEQQAGYILTCISFPLGRVVMDV
jgi:glycine betaine catabolism B